MRDTLDFITETSVAQRESVEECIVCADGATISVQASNGHYCSPRNDAGPWYEVEVGFPSVKPPESWKPYAEEWKRSVKLFTFSIPFFNKEVSISRYVDNQKSTVYAYVPVSLVRDFIYLHGGEK